MSALRLLLRAGGHASTAWSPYSIPLGLRCLWLSARDHGITALMTDDGAGLISSFSGRNSTTFGLGATTTARPTWSATGMGGIYPALTGDGVATAMALASAFTLPTGSDPLTLIALGQSSSVSSQHLFSYGGTGANTLRRIVSLTDGTLAASNGSTSIVATVARTWATPVIAVGSWATDLTLSVRADGGAYFGSATMASNNTGTTRTRLLAGNGSSAAAFWTGPFSEMIGLRASLADALPYVQKIEGWLAWTAYPALNLANGTNPFPAGHPYKNGPP